MGRIPLLEVLIMNPSKIECGDLVSIDFNSSKFTLTNGARVIYIPCIPGDSWIIRDEHSRDKSLIYINEPCTITLREKFNEKTK